MLWKVCPYMKNFNVLRLIGFSYSVASLSPELKRISTVSSGLSMGQWDESGDISLLYVTFVLRKEL